MSVDLTVKLKKYFLNNPKFYIKVLKVIFHQSYVQSVNDSMIYAIVWRMDGFDEQIELEAQYLWHCKTFLTTHKSITFCNFNPIINFLRL